jgi:DNA-binding NarL/FixJ family response regulator
MSITYSQTGNPRRETEGSIAVANVTARSAPVTSPQRVAVVIEKRQFIRDCLARALRSASGQDVLALSSVEEWLDLCEHTPACVVLLSGHGLGDSAQLCQKIQKLAQVKNRVPTIILSDAEDMGNVMDALDKGVKGYIPTTLSLDVVVEAMRLVRAGGVFIPASCLSAARQGCVRPAARTALSRLFTARQEAVVQALRQGKANKMIAYELQLQESTVKVHIRNIMKKLKAKNRTEVAYIVGQIADSRQVESESARITKIIQ